MKICAVIDAMGVQGNFFHYALIISLVGSAFIIFFYLWRKNRLDMDEEPKFQMMQDEEVKQGDCQHASRRKR